MRLKKSASQILVNSHVFLKSIEQLDGYLPSGFFIKYNEFGRSIIYIG
ncbi:hypothetical protein J2Z40_003611 [Cytobacillus eiseniae]|uniref:GIY-YIG domain-containing protein n=1 Tax=Cytobacillus eiseniae TaxID=762947 RepID=A0ABS4RL52_9BACI|nr:hypothetical protein [Cytobacillus eiseniae]